MYINFCLNMLESKNTQETNNMIAYGEGSWVDWT